VIPNGTGSVVNTATVTANEEDPNSSNNASVVIIQVVDGSGNPIEEPKADTDTNGETTNSCSSSLAGAPKLSDTVFNLGLLLLPLLIFSIRAMRRRN
jgi:hypothetical protein